MFCVSLCRVPAGSPSIRVHFECLSWALCCMCTCSRLFREARDTSKPCPFERQSTSGAFFLRSMIFSEWKFLKFGRSTEQNTARCMVGGSGPRCLSLEHSHRLFQLLPGVLVWLRADTSCRPCFRFACVLRRRLIPPGIVDCEDVCNPAWEHIHTGPPMNMGNN